MPEAIGLFAEVSAATETAASTPNTAEEGRPPELVYGSAEEFLHEQLLPTYVREVDGRAAKWCVEWFFHPEAVSRIEALWRAWEHLRLDPATGISVWWRDHADHHMRVLLDPDGPFYDCDMKTHRDSEHLEPKKAPPGWFPDVRKID